MAPTTTTTARGKARQTTDPGEGTSRNVTSPPHDPENDPEDPEDPDDGSEHDDESEGEEVDEDVLSKIQEPKLRDPENFYGERHKLDGWLTQLEVKFGGNPRTFQKNIVKLYYAYSKLRGNALSWAKPRIKAKKGSDLRLTKYSDFVTKVTAAFGERDPESVAYKKLQELKQGTNDVSTYYTRFTELCYQLNWTDNIKIQHFLDGLSETIKEYLIGRDDFSTDFEEYAELCIMIDNQKQRFKKGDNKKSEHWRKKDHSFIG